MTTRQIAAHAANLAAYNASLRDPSLVLAWHATLTEVEAANHEAFVARTDAERFAEYASAEATIGCYNAALLNTPPLPT